MKVRYHINPQTEVPHTYDHDVSEPEVEEVLERPAEDRPGKEGSRVAIGSTSAGRIYMRVIYVPDPEPNSVFVVTASKEIPSGLGRRARQASDQALRVAVGG